MPFLSRRSLAGAAAEQSAVSEGRGLVVERFGRIDLLAASEGCVPLGLVARSPSWVSREAWPSLLVSAPLRKAELTTLADYTWCIRRAQDEWLLGSVFAAPVDLASNRRSRFALRLGDGAMLVLRAPDGVVFEDARLWPDAVRRVPPLVFATFQAVLLSGAVSAGALADASVTTARLGLNASPPAAVVRASCKPKPTLDRKRELSPVINKRAKKKSCVAKAPTRPKPAAKAAAHRAAHQSVRAAAVSFQGVASSEQPQTPATGDGLDHGATGPTGPQGQTGSTGPTGAQGATQPPNDNVGQGSGSQGDGTGPTQPAVTLPDDSAVPARQTPQPTAAIAPAPAVVAKPSLLTGAVTPTVTGGRALSPGRAKHKSKPATPFRRPAATKSRPANPKQPAGHSGAVIPPPTAAGTLAPLGAPLNLGGLTPNSSWLASGSPGVVLVANQPPPFLVPIYKAAGHRYNIPWRVLAAINALESDYGHNLSVSSAGAEGWMQFMPDTWRRWAVGDKNPYNPRDAVFTAARYLRASEYRGEYRGQPRYSLRHAIYLYNHAHWYVEAVLLGAQLLGGGGHATAARVEKALSLPLDPWYMSALGRTDDGVDIETAPDGALVYSMTSGVVTAVASNPAGFGPDYPVIKATSGPLRGQDIYYGHVAKSLVKRGDKIYAGQPIALIGHTGDAMGLGHGHIEVGFSDGSGDPLNHHGLEAWTSAGQAIRTLLVSLSANFGIRNS